MDRVGASLIHLIAPLVPGVIGAEGGTVEIYRRGTSTRATYYTDFEATASVSSGVNVQLDSHGGAVVYVNELVNVIVKSSAGETVRTFVAGAAAAAIEYQGQGFSGVNYLTGATGTGSGYPTTLQAILDLWLTSAGAPDFGVLAGGTETTLQTAIGRLSGLVFNVQSPEYGAVGDGATNDGTAIDAAITAATANGGVVYFPPGTYRRTTRITLPAKVSLLGAGPNASIITIDHASNTLLYVEGSVTYSHQSVAGLRLTASQANSGNMVSLTGGSKITFENCHIGGVNCDGILVLVASSTTTLYKITDCVFEIGSLGAAAVSHAGVVSRATYRGCRFIVPAGTYSPTPAAVISANNIDLHGCVFDGSAATAGTFSYFLANSTTTDAQILGGTFSSVGAGTAAVTAINLGVWTSSALFYENANIFGASGLTAYGGSPGAIGAQVTWGSRTHRKIQVTNDEAATTLPTSQYGVIVVRRTTNANQAFLPDVATGNVAPEGAGGVIIVWNNSGGSITTEGPTAPFKPAVLSVLADGNSRQWRYDAMIIDGAYQLLVHTEVEITGI